MTDRPILVQPLNAAAFDIAISLGGFGTPNGATGYNDKYDAFRHAWASAIVTEALDGNVPLEGGIAGWLSKQILDFNEFKNNPPTDPVDYARFRAEENMDKFNNDVGRREYYKWKEAVDSGATNSTLAKWIYDKVNEGATINDMSDQREWYEPARPYMGPAFPREPGKRGGRRGGGTGGGSASGASGGFNGGSQARSPLVLDLDGDGVETLSTGSACLQNGRNSRNDRAIAKGL
jgi:hypothetical protein